MTAPASTAPPVALGAAGSAARRALAGLSSRFIELPEAARAAIVFVAAFVVQFLRRPEALLRAEFLVEDGAVFYVGTYFGTPLEILFRPYAGYELVLVRLVAFVERLVPVQLAPVVANGTALALLAALAAFIASSRLSRVIPDARLRAGLAALLVLLPGVNESVGVMTNIMHFAPLYLLGLSVARPPGGRLWLGVDLVVLGLTSLTGPYGALLQPLFWWRAWRQRDRYSLALAAILAVGSAVQGVTFLINGRRPGDPADPLYVVAVFIYRATVGAMVGQQTSSSLGAAGISPVVGVVATALVVASVGWVWWRGVPRAIGVRLLFVWAVVGIAALVGQREGPIIGHSFALGRYFVTPVAIIVLVLAIAIVTTRLPAVRLVALGLAAAVAFAAVRDFRLPVAAEQGWAERSHCIGGADPCRVPVWPPANWTIEWPGSDGPWVQPRPGA